MAVVHHGFELFSEFTTVFLLVVWGQSVEGEVSDFANGEPVRAFFVPAIERRKGDGVGEAKGDEVGSPVLTPVGEVASGDEEGGVFVEGLKVDSGSVAEIFNLGRVDVWDGGQGDQAREKFGEMRPGWMG